MMEKHLISLLLILSLKTVTCQQSIFTFTYAKDSSSQGGNSGSQRTSKGPDLSFVNGLNIGTMQFKPPDEDNSVIIKKGWLKYFYYMSDEVNIVPSKFEYNPAYEEQSTPGFVLKSEKDKFGAMDIPSPLHFFFVLTKRSLYVLSARKNGIARTIKSLQINWLYPINPMMMMSGTDALRSLGGLEDIGNYKEGFCFRLKSKTGIIWDMCADTIQDKKSWMYELMKLLPFGGPQAQMTGTYGGIIPTKFVYNASLWYRGGSTNLKPKRDGQWVIVHPWSQCSKACGGGKQYLQRLCIPPEGGGKACLGESIIDRVCNINPCPKVFEDDTNGNNTSSMPAKLKFAQLSSRWQRYYPCIIKESFHLLSRRS